MNLKKNFYKLNKMSEIQYPKFEDNKISTKTIIANTNLTLNIEELYKVLPVTEYTLIPKKRGRKKSIPVDDPNKDILTGSIITVKYENNIRGVEIKKKKAKNRGKFFRNSITVIMVIDGKKINYKVSKNGKFQITGCKSSSQAKKCIKHFWTYIIGYTSLYKFTTGTYLEVLFIPAMRNIDFTLGFFIDREKLSHFINLMTEYYSMLETTFGYTGVNVKFPITKDITTMKIKKISNIDNEWVETDTTYLEYLDLLPAKEKEKKISKDRYNTFLCFHSGRIIHSGLNYEYMVDDYYKFIEIIKRCRSEIEERIIPTI